MVTVNGLLQFEQHFNPPVPLQASRHLFPACLDPVIRQIRQFVRSRSPWRTLWYAHFRLRYDSGPSGSIAASAAKLIGRNCLQFLTVDRSLFSDCPLCRSHHPVHLVGLRRSLVRYWRASPLSISLRAWLIRSCVSFTFRPNFTLRRCALSLRRGCVQNKGLATVGVSVDILYENLKNSEEAWSRVKPFIRVHKVNYQILMGATTQQSNTISRLCR
jgi:hypothetical protein